MAINLHSSAIGKTNSYTRLSTAIISTLMLMHQTWANADERKVTITEPGGTSTHYFSSPNADTFTTEQIRQPVNNKQIKSHNNNFWINQASVQLNTDHDHDGHFSSFTLTLDVDTLLAAPAVYAVLYLSLQDNNWIEYAVSSQFTVYGSGSYDAYSIETNLDSGYPSGYYDQYIEIYDAYSHELLISHGPEDSYAFQGLPIESSFHDNRFTVSSAVSLTFTGSGSLGLPLILPLACVWGYRRWAGKQCHKPVKTDSSQNHT